MTADVDLLPLPSVLLNWPHPTNHAAIRDYARANVAELQREVEALRAEVEDGRRRHAATERDACQLASRLNASEKRAETVLAEAFEWRDKFSAEKARAERLAGALREYADPENWAMCEGKRRIWMEPRSSTPDAYHGHELACAALDQETTNG